MADRIFLIVLVWGLAGLIVGPIVGNILHRRMRGE